MSLAVLTIPPAVTLLLAIPVIGLGHWLTVHVRVFGRFSVPAPIVGGLCVALGVLVFRLADLGRIHFELGTSLRAWTWLVTAEPEWRLAPAKAANLPFLAVFFACVGLNASWRLVRGVGRPVGIFLIVAAVFAVIQNLVGLLMAAWLDVSPLLGLVCGSMSLTGGHATTLGFAAEFEKAGLAGAQALGTASATFGLVAGAVLAGPLGSVLIRRRGLAAQEGRPETQVGAGPAATAEPSEARFSSGRRLLAFLLVLALCLKAGAWISYLLQRTGVTFPVFVGTLTAGVAVRAILDSMPAGWFEPRLAERIASVALAVFLATAMMTLNLHELAFAAGPMLAILAVQTGVMLMFAWWVTFPAMGRDYEAAVMAGGHCGFGLGSTATAVAAMKSLAETSGPAPRAFLVVPLVGGFLVDLFNVINLTAFITFARSL